MLKLRQHGRKMCTSAAESQQITPAAAMRWAIGGSSFFIAENVLLSEYRQCVIELLGDENRYRLLYGAMSTVASSSIAIGFYRIRGARPLRWAVGATPAPHHVACFLLQAIGFAGLAQSLPKLQIPLVTAGGGKQVTPTPIPGAGAGANWSVRCPFDFSKPDGLHGVQRISRHASLWSFASVCLGAAAVTSSMPQAVCLSMPCMVALIGGAHHDSRARRSMGTELPPDLDAVTSNVPGLALLSGAQGGVASVMHALGDEIKWVNAALGAGLAVLLLLRRVR